MQMIERTMRSWDGAELSYRGWLPEQPSGRSLLLFHRGHEHSGRWAETVASLSLDGVSIFAWDQRGHGRSQGDRGAAADIADVVKDAEVFARHICREQGLSMQEMAVVAHSVGAVIAAAWVHDYAPPIRALVLAAPAFRVKLYLPFAVPMLRLKRKLLGGTGGIVKSYVKARVLTHDPAERMAYQADAMIFRQIAVNVLVDLHDLSTRLLADAGAFTVPLLVLSAGNDWVVELSAQEQFYRNASSTIKRLELLPGFFHAIFHEKQRQLVVSKIREFLLENFDQPGCNAQIRAADRGGYTRTEYDLLRCPGGVRWAVVRGSMRALGRISHGIGLGWQRGFDSGVMLDCVYENKPAGVTPIGRLVDRIYLNSIGWRGIRLRRRNLQQILRQCIMETHQQGRPVRILDIASGPGRYVIETIAAMRDVPITALLRDYRQANLDAASALAAQLGVKEISIALGDAFDRESLSAVTPRPTIAIVSGLYELFPGNDMVSRSLAGLADAVEEGGWLIYTNQPWHPQVEFIARALINREGEPWIMRRRIQAEMDELVRAAGFEKVQQEIDPWGIFSVSLARRTVARK